jgi:hypothetical protein
MQDVNVIDRRDRDAVQREIRPGPAGGKIRLVEDLCMNSRQAMVRITVIDPVQGRPGSMTSSNREV